MLHWYKDLYMDEIVKKNPPKAKKRVEWCHKSFKKSLYFWKQSYYAIMLASNPNNLFEIIETRQLFFRHFQNKHVYIIGLAGSKQEAITIVQIMVEKLWQKDSELRVREFFETEDFE